MPDKRTKRASASPPPRKGPLSQPDIGPAKPRPRRLGGIADGPTGGHPKWRLSFIDLDYSGTWSWDIDIGTLITIINFLREMERLTWTEVRAMMAIGKRRGDNKHKFIPAEHVCTEAQRRLEELKMDDVDQLFRFRLGNMGRLWGVIHEDTFYVVWWDPDHKVCPSKDN